MASGSSDKENDFSESETRLASLSRWRPQDIVFSFGPNGDYFISSQLDSWRFYGWGPLRDSLRILHGGRPIAVALSPDGGGIWVYEDAVGKVSVNLSTANFDISSLEAEAWTLRHKQYEAMQKFVVAGEDDGPTTDIALSVGSRGSWFARCGKKIAHHGLPKRLANEIEERKPNGVYPLQVTLGCDGDYAALWSGEPGASWSINPTNECIKYLKAGEKVNTILLSPYNPDTFFLVTEAGEILHRISGLPSSEIKEICDQSKAFMQRSARRSGRTLEWDANVDGVKENFRITPKTDFDTSRSPSGLQQTRLPKAWHLDRMERAVKERPTVIAAITAATVSAVVVGSMARYHRTTVMATAGTSAASTPAATRFSKMPVRHAAAAAAMAAVGTAAACTWLIPKT